MASNTICLYHSVDLDGLCSAAIVRQHRPEAEFYPIDYGEALDFERLNDRHVILVDFSFPPETMQRIHSMSRSFIWIDHHESALRHMEGAAIKLEGRQVVGRAACALTWDYFYGSSLPTVVEHLGLYDVWELAHPDTLPIQYGVRALKPTLENWPIELFSPTCPFDILRTGRLIWDSVDAANASFAKIVCFETVFEDRQTHALHPIIAANRGPVNSLFFRSVFEPVRHDFMVPFWWAPKIQKWRVSLYGEKTSPIALNKLAEFYGGGGHLTAAGFQCDTLGALPFKVIGGIPL